MTDLEADRRLPPERRGPPRRAVGAVLVAAVYGLLVMGAPLLVRYGPEPEVSAAVARVAIGEVATPRCAYAPEFGRSCTPEAVPARAKAKDAVFTE